MRKKLPQLGGTLVLAVAVVIFPFLALANDNLTIQASGTTATPAYSFSATNTHCSLNTYDPSGNYLGTEFSSTGCVATSPNTGNISYIPSGTYGTYKFIGMDTGPGTCGSDSYSTCISSDLSSTYETATYAYSAPSNPPLSFGTVWSAASTTGVFSGVATNTGSILLYVLLGVATTVVALMGLGYAIRHIKKWILGRKF